jgi:hypothetical protein
MEATAIDHGLVLAQGFGAPRTPGLHMSDLYGALYAALDPARYGKGGAPPLEKFELGMAFEDMLEEGLKRRLVLAEGSGRPGEFVTEHEAGCPNGAAPLDPEHPCHCGAGIVYSPDLLIFNGVTRLGEIKLTFMSTKGAPWALGETIGAFDPKFNKYFCVAPETPLLTSGLQYRPAGDMQVGDRVLAFEEQAPAGSTWRHLQHTDVEAVQFVRKPCVRLHFADGTSVVCSTDHHWFGKAVPGTNARWIRTDKLLKPTSRGVQTAPAVCRVVPASWSSRLSEWEQGWVSGVFDGEGSIGRANKHHGTLVLTVSQNPGPVFDRLQDLLHRDGFDWPAFVPPGGTCHSLKTGSMPEIFRCLGMYRPVRLLDKFQYRIEKLPGFSYSMEPIVHHEFLGEQWVAGVQTTARTFLAAGLASHNTQMKLYCYHLGLTHARLYVFFVRGDYKGNDQILRAWDLTFTQEELMEEWEWVKTFAQEQGLLPPSPLSKPGSGRSRRRGTGSKTP